MKSNLSHKRVRIIEAFELKIWINSHEISFPKQQPLWGCCDSRKCSSGRLIWSLGLDLEYLEEAKGCNHPFASLLKGV